jgi:hypothetical protein
MMMICSTYYKVVRAGGGCVFITVVPITKLFAGGGRGGEWLGGHVLRETTSRGQCELVCPSRTGTREEPGTLTQGDCEPEPSLHTV